MREEKRLWATLGAKKTAQVYNSPWLKLCIAVAEGKINTMRIAIRLLGRLAGKWDQHLPEILSAPLIEDASRIFDPAWYAARKGIPMDQSSAWQHFQKHGLFEGDSPHPLFDAHWYLETNPDVITSGLPAFVHFISYGAHEGRSPHPLFDSIWYAKLNSEVVKSGINPLRHYLEEGAQRGLNPHPLFDGGWYLSSYPDVAAAQINPLVHFVSTGWKEERSPHPLFDSAWYLNAYPDIAAAQVNPLVHFVEIGGLERRSPHPLFDTDWYLETNTDVAVCGVNSLSHFVTVGGLEGRSPHPLFDSAWYLGSNPDVAANEVNPLTHFIMSGGIEGRSPHPLFDVAWYLETNSNAAQAGLNPLRHYLESDTEECYSPHLLFDARWYLNKHPSVVASGLTPLDHYVRCGERLGYSPHPLFDASLYLETYGDVAVAQINPLVHFVTVGQLEGRESHPLFCARWYRDTYADVASATHNPLSDYLKSGASEGRNPNLLFDSAWYLREYPDVKHAGRNPLIDYILEGAQAGRKPNPIFEALWYLKRYPEAVADDQGPLANALRWSPEEIAPSFDVPFYRLQTGLKNKNSAECLAHYLASRSTRILRSIADVDQDCLDRAMGTGLALVPQTIAVGMVLYNEESSELARSLQNIRVALQQCGPAISGHIYLFDNGEQPSSVVPASDLTYVRSVENLGFGAGHNALCRRAFETVAEVYVGINSDGLLHRDALAALLRMHAAQSGQALIEALQFPEEHPKFYDPESLETSWISCACYLIPKSIYEAVGGFDPNIFLYCEDVDLSWSAQRAGFRTMVCPAALFFHDVSDRGHEAWRFREMLISGRYLSYKWGGADFRSWVEDLLILQGFARHRDQLPPLDDLAPLPDRITAANFGHGFSFAPVRW